MNCALAAHSTTTQVSTMIATTQPCPSLDERPVFDLFAAFIQSRTVKIALRIGLFEAFKAPASGAQLRETLCIGERAIEALLSILAASGLVDLSQPPHARFTQLAREYFLNKGEPLGAALFSMLMLLQAEGKQLTLD